ncbi:hypothetical protein Pelo_11895 [Pelomyxa schiedti]|nr:hypothetical protein Pelo_11895 [Pelomyxa schiedti]
MIQMIITMILSICLNTGKENARQWLSTLAIYKKFKEFEEVMTTAKRLEKIYARNKEGLEKREIPEKKKVAAFHAAQPPQCYNCNEIGHYQKDCPKKHFRDVIHPLL